MIGRDDVMSSFGPGAMTSTHSGSPLSVAAGIGSIEAIFADGLVERAARLGPRLERGLLELQARWRDRIGYIRARGLVGGVRVVKPGTLEPDPDVAARIVEWCFRKGLLLFAPVGLGGGCLKIAPPLCIEDAALDEGLGVLEESFGEALR